MGFLRNRVGTCLGIALILLFGAIYFSISYNIIDSYLSNSYGPGYEMIYVSR